MNKKKELFINVHRWLIWVLGAFFMFYKYAIEVSPSVMTHDLMKEFSISGAQLGNLAACYFYSYLIMQIPAGILVDRWGPRKVTTLAIIVCAAGSFLFGRANNLWEAEVGRFLTGIGASFAAINCLKLIANWFPKRRFAFMAGLMMTMGMLGAVGGQRPLSHFIEMLGWRPAMEWIGIGELILAALFWLVIRDKAPGHKEEAVMASHNLSHRLKEIFQNPQAWWLSLYSGLAFAPVSVFGGLWGVSFLSEAFNLSSHTAAQHVSLIFIGFAVGAPCFGWFSDYLGKRKHVMFWGTLIAMFSLSAVLYIPTLSSFMVGMLLFIFGLSISSFLLCFTMICEISRPIMAATAIGFMNSFDAIIGAFSDPLTGKFLDLKWEGKIVDGVRIFTVDAYKIALTTLPIYLFISLTLLWLIKETFCKPSYPSTLP